MLLWNRTIIGPHGASTGTIYALGCTVEPGVALVGDDDWRGELDAAAAFDAAHATDPEPATHGITRMLGSGRVSEVDLGTMTDDDLDEAIAATPITMVEQLSRGEHGAPASVQLRAAQELEHRGRA